MIAQFEKVAGPKSTVLMTVTSNEYRRGWVYFGATYDELDSPEKKSAFYDFIRDFEKMNISNLSVSDPALLNAHRHDTRLVVDVTERHSKKKCLSFLEHVLRFWK